MTCDLCTAPAHHKHKGISERKKQRRSSALEQPADALGVVELTGEGADVTCAGVSRVLEITRWRPRTVDVRERLASDQNPYPIQYLHICILSFVL